MTKVFLEKKGRLVGRELRRKFVGKEKMARDDRVLMQRNEHVVNQEMGSGKIESSTVGESSQQSDSVARGSITRFLYISKFLLLLSVFKNARYFSWFSKKSPERM